MRYTNDIIPTNNVFSLQHPLGTMTKFFWRDEHQGNGANLPHLHVFFLNKENNNANEGREFITFLEGVHNITKEAFFVSSTPKCYVNMEWSTTVFTIERINQFIITEHLMNGRRFFLFVIGLTNFGNFMETFNHPSEQILNLFRLDSIVKSTEEIRDYVQYMMSGSELFHDHVDSRIVASLMENIISVLTPAVTRYIAAIESGTMSTRTAAFEDLTRPRYWTMLQPHVDRMADDNLQFEPIVTNTLKIITIYITILFHHMYHLESVEGYDGL